jgi:VCBS repeat-containing protein
VVWSGGGIPAGYDISALSAPSALILNGGTPSLVASAATVSLPWVYDPAALNLDWLREGQSLTITYPITVTDNQNAAVSQNLVIVLTGTNDTPLISQGNDSAAFTETGATLSETGTMLVEDLDWSDTVALSVDSVAFSGSFITNGRTLPSSLTSNTNQALRAMLALSSDSETISSLAATPGGGSEFNWTFTSGSSGTSAFNFLQQGETLTLTYTVAASDNSPVRAGKESSKATETVAVTITGTNNDPTITIETGDTATATLTETNGGLVNTLSLTVRDVDLSNTVSPSIDSVAISGSYPGLADLDNATIKSYLSTNFRFESGLLKFTADNAAEVYLNGSLIGSTNNWGQPYTFSNLNVLPGKNVLSVLAWDYGSIAAMSGLFTMADGSTFGTSNISGWKVFNADPVPTSDYSGNSTVRSAWNLPSGWNTVAYDDSDTALWRTPQDTRTVESWYP